MGQKEIADDRGRKVEAGVLEFPGNLEAAIAKDVASLAEVRHVLTERADGNLLVWIAIDNAESYKVRSRIYDKELEWMDEFPDVNFDFNLIPAMGRTAKDLASGAKIIYSRA